ncbi:HU family DNA-binding protein [soil metagenome]
MAKKAAPKAAEKPATTEKATAAKAKPMSKTELYTKLAEKTNLTKKDIANVFENLDQMVKSTLANKKGPQQFVIPGLLKIRAVRKPATKAKPGRNPATGETITIAAKPARNVVKVTPLKALKDSV